MKRFAFLGCLSAAATLVVPTGADAQILTTDNLTYNWVANFADNSSDWQSTGPASNTVATWNTHQATGTSAFPDAELMPVTSVTGLNQAYFFDGVPTGGGSEARLDLAGGTAFVSALNGLAPTASFEVFFQPSDLVGNEVIFETGGNARGLTLALRDETLYAFSKQAGGIDDTELILSSAISALDVADFAQVVFTTDGATSHNLYLNGLLVDSSTLAYGDFGGGDVAALAAGTPGGFGGLDGDGGGVTAIDDAGSFTNLNGAIGIVRVYDDVLTPAEVLSNSRYQVIPEPASFALAMLGLIGVAARRRK